MPLRDRSSKKQTRNFPLILGAVAALLLLGGSPAEAGPVVQTKHATVEILTEKEAVAPGETQWIGLWFKPIAGWHVYWKNPGDSGLPPRAEFSSSTGGSRFSALEFPTPEKMPYGPLMNYAYEGQVLYLAKWTAPAEIVPGENVTLSASVKWLICKEECVPGKALLDVTLPVESKEKLESIGGSHTKLFAEAFSALPINPPNKVEIDLKRNRLELTYRGTLSKADLPRIYFFSDSDVGVAPTAKQVVSLTSNGVRVSIPRDPANTKSASDVRGILKLRENRSVIVGEAVVDSSSPEKSALTVSSSNTDSTGLGLMLLFALLGGVILNLMPCILPVLSIKVMEIASQSGIKTKAIRKHGLVFTLGVLVSFWVLALVLLILRAGGTKLGWGFQLQSPYFIATLAILFFLMAMNLFGFFEVGDRLMGVGGNFARKEGYAGSFFTGVLTTVAATPCSAPFMGTALGFALTQSAFQAILVLTFLGLGLALPYLVFSFLPNAAKILPKPGMWMKTLKEFLAFPLLATTVWLCGVLGNQAGVGGIVAVLSALVLIVAVIWIYGHRADRALSRWMRGFLMVSFSMFAVYALSGLGKMQTARVENPGSRSSMVHAPWKEWSPSALKEALDAKQTVIVNITADWCVTCKVNETVVFNRDVVKAALGSANVTALLADWTNGDPVITDAMMKIGRNSVPVYLLYKNGSREPKILPQILSVSSLLKDLQ